MGMTSVAVLCWFILYGICAVATKTALILYSGAMFSEAMWLIIDILLVVVVPWSMTLAEPADELSSHAPSCNILTLRFGSCVIGLALIHICSSFLAHRILTEQDFYMAWDRVALGVGMFDWNSL